MKLFVSTLLLAIILALHDASAQLLPTQPISFPGQGCVDYDPSDGWLAGDRTEWEPTIVLPWDFGIVFEDFVSEPKNMIYISPNGFVTFDGIEPLMSVFNASGTSEPWIAAFLGDSDIRFPEGGNLWFKQIDTNRFAIVWEGIVNIVKAVDENGEPRRNTFQMVLSNGLAPEMGDNTVCFCYKDMQWTSDNASGFGESGNLHVIFPPGTQTVLPAVAGVDPLTVTNPITNVTMFPKTANHWRIGQFDRPGTEFNGPDGYSGVDYLDDKTYCFNSQKVIGVPRPNNEDLEPSPPPTSGPTSSPTTEDDKATQAKGDPHFKTWKDEHFEFHGQCDLVMISDKDFANGLGIDIHIRTKIVRFWSYIQKAVIRIGNDILEVEGAPQLSASYWINYEHTGELIDLAGFPVSLNKNSNRYTIDLDSLHPGEKIEISTFKEFVGVKVIGASASSFGKSVGIMGDFATGNTYARDGHTVLDDFNVLGNEWQVLPSDGHLFLTVSRPQFPEKCMLPENPQGARKRRLGESTVSEEDAEAACAGVEDEFSRKGCVYDILATQDLDMAGAY